MFKRTRSTVAALGMLLALSSDSPGADAPKKPSPFAAWRGVMSFTGYATSMIHSFGRQKTPYSWTDTETVTTGEFHFELERGGGGSENSVWNVTSCRGSGTEDYFSKGATFFRKSDHWWKGSYSGELRKEGNLTMDLVTGKWDVITTGFINEPFHVIGNHHAEESNGGVWHTDEWVIDYTTNNVPGIFVHSKLSGNAKPGVLFGAEDYYLVENNNKDHGVHRIFRVVLWPNYKDVECIVEIKDYDKWLPRALVHDAGHPGSKMLVKATLKPKDAAAKDAPHASRFRFELADTSREPGIAMNWPRFGAEGANVPDKDPNPDLKLSAFGGETELTAEDQKAFVAPMRGADGNDYAMAWVDAYDFGAWSNLRVVCELEDTREIPGMLKTPSGPTPDITLPKRSDGSKIADAWRNKYKLSANDGEDAEKSPVGDSNDGDGYSNYEEYRGFVVNGLHTRTRPDKKDLFIDNRIGPAARPGLSLFARLTQLAVHSTIKDSEMPESRVMNINRSKDSPRNSSESQHGLVLVYLPDGDASFADIADDVAWRPKNVDAVRILRQLGPGAGGNSNVLVGWPADEFAATIAHELSHSIGVRHHGETDLGQMIWMRRHSTVAGKTTYWFEERPAVYTGGSWNYGPAPGDHIRIFRDKTHQISPNSPSIYDTPQVVWVGCYNGQHSGSDQCIMRYDCSEAYVLPNRARDRFISPGEPTGMGICNSSAGTGVNAPSANPSRYSTAGVGDCVHRFAVRDDAPDSQSPPKAP